MRKKEDVWDVYSGGVARELRYNPTERARPKGGEQDPTATNKELLVYWGCPMSYNKHIEGYKNFESETL